LINIEKLCDAVGMGYSVLGSRDRHVYTAMSIERANSESLSFCKNDTSTDMDAIRRSNAGVIICSNTLSFSQDDYIAKTLILVDDPKLAFIRVIKKYFSTKKNAGIHSTAIVKSGATISKDTYIGPYTYVEECNIGSKCEISANVHIYPKTVIGSQVTIYDGTVVGKEGTSFMTNENGELERFHQIGGVEIGDNVDIGSNVVIERGTLHNTIIGKGSKINSLSRIGHNVIIGENCYICDQCYIGGNSVIEDGCWLAPGSIIRNAISIGRNSVIGMGSVVTKNIAVNSVVMGVPARVVRQNLSNWLSTGMPVNLTIKEPE
jgi:UDP-3-O-[3-hydroxymyristoyl] glucosamine N-acyltransferase